MTLTTQSESVPLVETQRSAMIGPARVTSSSKTSDRYTSTSGLHRDHGHAVRTQVAQRLLDLFGCLAEAEHQAGLGDEAVVGGAL